MLTLSVSSSTTASPSETASPSLLSHRPTVASTIDSPSCGTVISTGILSPMGLNLGSGISRPSFVDYPRLLRGMDVTGSLCGAGSFRAADIQQGHGLRQERSESRGDKGPGSHILRLLLGPHDVPYVGI